MGCSHLSVEGPTDPAIVRLARNWCRRRLVGPISIIGEHAQLGARTQICRMCHRGHTRIGEDSRSTLRQPLSALRTTPPISATDRARHREPQTASGKCVTMHIGTVPGGGVNPGSAMPGCLISTLHVWPRLQRWHNVIWRTPDPGGHVQHRRLRDGSGPGSVHHMPHSGVYSFHIGGRRR